ASESEARPGLTASAGVTSARAIAKKRGIARQTPRVNITIRRTALAKRRLGRSELRLFSDWNDGRPETELNFKFYRQATNKIIGISNEASALLRGFFYLPWLKKSLLTLVRPLLPAEALSLSKRLRFLLRHWMSDVRRFLESSSLLFMWSVVRTSQQVE